MKRLKFLMVIYDNASHISYFPLGAAYVASAVRAAGHGVEIYNMDIYHYTEHQLAQKLQQGGYDVVGLSVCGGAYQHDVVKRLCSVIHALNAPPPQIWLGGHLAAPEPEYFLREMGIDLIFKGEGEVSIKNALAALSEGRGYEGVNGVAFIKNGQFIETPPQALIENIDEIPYPAYDLFPMEHYVLRGAPGGKETDRVAHVISGRGCIFNCNFCFRLDKGFRARSAESILGEIKLLQERYAVTYISFADELLMSGVERTRSLMTAFIDSGLKFTFGCNGRLNFADPETLALMKRAGCVFINYGIESVDDGALKRMNKALTYAQIITGVENTLAAGISPGLNIIFGNFGETAEILERDVDFLIKYDDHAQMRTIRPVTPYPGSPLYDYCIEKGLLKGVADFYEKSRNSDLLTVNFTDLSDDEFYDALYDANKRLLDNYVNYQSKRNNEILINLYKNRDTSFRGFRAV